jgi:hypothetical protein
MSTSDGYVIGSTKIVDHGPDNLRWNLVIVGDGYQASEVPQYHTDVETFLAKFRTTPPLNNLFCGINVYRIDVVSTESGADDPGCGGNPPVTADTYFDATFCSLFSGTPLERLLTIDSASALSVATTYVPLRHQVLCIVNSSKYGGAGGTVATSSTNASSAEIAIHEIGHSAFGLADEYGGSASAPAVEPPEPNVTLDTNRATNKWGDLIEATTSMPSQCDPGCTSSSCVPPATPPAAGAVGTYEGAIYTDCQAYRPLPSCYMRNYAPFCPVCSRVITQTLQPFQPPESITLITPSLEFLNVPAGMGGIGVTTHRAIVWEVATCRELTFRITVGPTGGFGTTSEGTTDTVTADPILPAANARIWISYTSTNPGDSANGEVSVECDETGETWIVNLTANTIARPKAAVSLILDRSGSMQEDAGDGIQKAQKLREAADVFISVMQPNDGIGLVRFNSTANRLMEVEEAGASPGGAGRVTALGHINGSGLDPSGGTSIGDGVVKGKEMLDDAVLAATDPYDVTAMVVLTDGEWNQPPSLSDVSGSISANTYAVGLGLPSNISVPALTTLCQGNQGYMLITGALTTAQSMRLSKYFLQILAGVTNTQIAADPAGVLQAKSEHRIPFRISEADYGMDLIVLSSRPQYIHMELEAPDGSRVTPTTAPGSANSQFVLSRYASFYRCALPVFPAAADGSHEGVWHAVLKVRRRPGTHSDSVDHVDSAPGAINFDPKQPRIPYEFVAHAYSSLVLDTQVSQTGYQSGSFANISATLHEYDAPFIGSAKVWAEITRPDKLVEGVLLKETASGLYAAEYVLDWQGIYQIRIRASGETRNGTAFDREQTATTVAGTVGQPETDGNGFPSAASTHNLCRLLHCLGGKKLFDGKLGKNFSKWGFKPERLILCFEKWCRPYSDQLETRVPRKPEKLM